MREEAVWTLKSSWLAARAPAVMSRGMMRSRGVVFMVKKVFLTY